jgi:signal transduction histidine kinase/CheY-like chemotaxis protein
MPSAPIPEDEPARLAALHASGVLDTEREAVFDDIADLAAALCQSPMAMVSFVAADRQWFKAKVGLQAVETPRSDAFCAHAILADQVLVVPDATLDPRFADSPLVLGAPHVRSYAGAPIQSASGHLLGTVCAIDTVPRPFAPAQIAGLTVLARQVGRELELRRALNACTVEHRELREAHQRIDRLRLLLEQSQAQTHVGGWEFDLDSNTLYWTPETYRLHDLDPESGPPDVTRAIDFYTPASRPQITAAVHQAIAHGTPYQLELELVTATGRPIWVWTTGRAVRESGRTVRLLGAFQDITERRRAHADLERAKAAAEAANRAKSAFLATMSHEIRTPLHGILGYTELIRGTALDHQQQAYTEAVLGSGRTLLQLLDDILDLSKLEAGKLGVSCTTMLLQPAVEEVLQLLRATATAKQIPLSLHDETGTAAYVQADAQRVRQVLLNLVGNAVKFTDHGHVAVRLTTAASGHLLVAVEDSGIGIAADDLPQLFQDFSQVDAAPNRRFAGTGLGLAISRRLVEAMGGQVGVASEPGHGSTFWFTLPQAAAPTAAATSSAIAPDPATAPWQPPPGRRVLVAEDHPLNQRLLTAMLSRHGIVVAVAHDGAEAIAKAAATPFDLVLMDCRMPGTDGFAATRAIRAQEASGSRRVPIVALTANAMAEDRAECLAAGMDDFVAKPFSRATLDASLRRWLGSRDG